jgi:hypothetical protein
LAQAQALMQSDAAPEQKAVASRAEREAMDAIHQGLPDPGPFTYRQSVQEAARQRKIKAQARYDEWLRTRAQRECEWFLSNPAMVRIRGSGADVDIYWQDPKLKPILQYWNSRAPPELKIH